ncbi:MAG: hypothetical protein ACPGU1_09870 [Myxococcota bacterium]
MRSVRTDLLSCLILTLTAAWAAPTASATSRTAVADVTRLSGYGEGPITAVGPGLDVAAGLVGASALGDRGSDADKMNYRELIHARVTLKVASTGARRIDLIIKTVNQAREVTVSLDGAVLGVERLDGTWQRLSFRTQPLNAGPHTLSLTMSPTGQALSGDASPKALAHLHSVRLSTVITPPSSPVTETFAGGDALWLEAGEVLRIPTPALPSHALRTAGTLTRGAHDDLRAVVAFETLEGAIATKLSLPAALALPWNLHLADSGERTPKYLRIGVSGASGGAIGLVQPELTLPTPEIAARMGSTERLILIAIPGLRSEDAADALEKLPNLAVSHTWSTSPRRGPALASLLTGHYADSHGLIKRSDQTATRVTTLATAMKAAGRQTVLRAGHVPHAKDAHLWSGYQDSAFSNDGDFKHTAEAVLNATLTAVSTAAPGPIFATAVLGDIAAPYLPRGDAWTAHWPSNKRTPWDARDGRKQLERQRTSGKAPRQDKMDYWHALRRGKVDEVVAALAAFLKQVDTLTDTRVVIVGLAGEGPFPASGPPTLTTLKAPIALYTAEGAQLPTDATDLTDVHATLLALGGARADAAPGHRYDVVESSAWSDIAFASVGSQWDLALTEKLAVLKDRVTGKVLWLEHGPGVDKERRWLPRAGSAFITDTLLRRRMSARQCAGPRWQRSLYSPAVVAGRENGRPL